jgi:acyl-CoA reductase-like NAD-dependent aldehyde dehydrogenase
MPHLISAVSSPRSSQEEIDSIRAKMQAIHNDSAGSGGGGGVNLTLQWRVDQLKRLERLVVENREAIYAALLADLGKDRGEAMPEIAAVEGEIKHCLGSVSKWMQPKHVPSPSLSFPSRSTLVPMPLAPPGVLVIGPSNYPLMLSLHPAVGALAAGNPVLVKPSDLCPETAKLMKRLIDQYFAETHGVQCILADAPKTGELFARRWGMVFFTGSERVGRILTQAAAQTLTPVVLELGGKSPCIVDETCPANIQQAAHRIVWAKLFNTGQTCAAVDYVLVHESLAKALVQGLEKAIRAQFPADQAGRAGELGRIVCRAHAQRHVDMLKEVEGWKARSDNKPPPRIVVGGSSECDVNIRYVAPTLVVDPPLDSRMMKEEIFGPILPVLTFTTRQEAIGMVHSISGMAPLCLYAFTNSDKVFQQIFRSCRAGGVVRNDCLVHLASRELPFGGLGTSGHGNYHGKFSFDTFSQLLPVVFRPCVAGSDLGMARFHPFAGGKVEQMEKLMDAPYIPVLKPTFLAILALAAIRSPFGWNLLASALEKVAAFMRQRD